MYSCADKVTPVLIEQAGRIDADLQSFAKQNPSLISNASAVYNNDTLSVDVQIADSLFMTAFISEPLFNYFTACEVKNHLDKNLEITVNALTEKNAPVIVKLTDVYGDSSTYTISPATLRRMVKSPLTQLGFNEARDALFAAFAASEELFRPQERGVKEISTSFKGGFFAYNITFDNPRNYRGITSANLKARAIKVLNARYAHIGTLRPVLFGMFKSLGIDGFHLVYNAGDGTQPIKATVTLANIK